MDLEQELDRLYQAKPGAFVSERNDLVRKLRQSGLRDAAATVAALPRPTPAAWAINQLHFRARGELSALEKAGAALKDVQESLGDSEEFARHKREHQQALRLAADRAILLCEEGGIATSVSLRRRLEMTLNLLSATPGTEPAPGRLSVELEPRGFDSLSIAAAPPAREPKAKATGALDPAADAAEKARVAALRTEIAELERRLPELESAAERSRLRYREADERSTEASRLAEEARHAREDALRDANETQKQIEELKRTLDQSRRRLP